VDFSFLALNSQGGLPRPSPSVLRLVSAAPPPSAPVFAAPVFAVGPPDGLPLSLLKAAVLAQVTSGDARLVLDLRRAGRLDPRAAGTLLYVLALCREAGGALALRLTTDQRTALSPYPPLLAAEEPTA
jgi:hypothetical protein